LLDLSHRVAGTPNVVIDQFEQSLSEFMIRSLLNIALILITFFFVYFESFYLQVWPPQIGQKTWVTLRSVTAFSVEPLNSERHGKQAPETPFSDTDFSTPQPSRRADAPLNPDQPTASVDRPGPRVYQPGDILVPFRKQIDSEDQRMLNAYQRQMAVNLPDEAPWVAFLVVFMVLFYHFFLTGIVEGGFQKSVPAAFLLTLFILHLALLKAILLTVPLPSIVIPFALLPLLIIITNQGRITAIGTTVVAAVLVGLFVGNIYPMTLLLLISGLTAVMAAGGIQKRSQIIWPSLAIGIVNVLAYITMTGSWPATVAITQQASPIQLDTLRSLTSEPLLKQIGLAFLGGFSVGPLALILLPLLELSTHNASRFKLNRYTDLQQPLVKKLFSDAPGTYQHSMTVSYLAQSAGEAIGANSLLLRIGAYYHDIGKMDHPRNFIENQFNGENPHDDLEPDESVDLIIDHVKRGVRFGFDARLPKVVVDLIQQHHGTQIIEYFYNSATNAYPNKPVREKDFRYPGPKPQTIEAAILMISDAVEAASRSLQSPNRRNFEKMVRMIILKRIADGQFSECGLDTREIEVIIRTLVDCLEASFHSRVQYPWQKKPGQRKGKGKGWITGFDDKDMEQQSFRL
jgi:putative nucleotidyltransferase with HDIG domain